jgi:hypothetical protein
MKMNGRRKDYQSTEWHLAEQAITGTMKTGFGLPIPPMAF